MPDILHTIIATKRSEMAALRAPKPSLAEALAASPTGIIAEFKRRSPSKGWIREDGRADVIPAAYEQAGAAALSILTDEHYFAGSDDFIRAARHSGVALPILYKNFVIDEAQLYQAAICGASAVLLIAACLEVEECEALTAKAHSLGLEVLLELHDEKELVYTNLPVDAIGINNRNLGTFHTDVENSFRMIQYFDPKSRVLVSESGISDAATIRALRQAGFRGFLIGESFMREADPAAALAAFIRELEA